MVTPLGIKEGKADMKLKRCRDLKAVLTENEELLLMRFRDGEASWRERWSARRLLGSCSAARDYLEQLGVCGDFIQWRSTRIEHQLPASWTLFPGIQREIEKQELLRAVTSPRKGGWVLNAETIVRVGWGLTGALTAASVMILVAPSPEPESKRERGVGSLGVNPLVAASVQPVRLSPVSTLSGARSSAGSAQTHSPLAGQQYGITWFSSGGKVRVIGGSRSETPVLWISRNGRVSRRASPTPDVPSAVFANDRRVAQSPLLGR